VHSSREQRSLRGIYETFTGEVIGILPVWFALTIVLGFFLFLPGWSRMLGFPTSANPLRSYCSP